MSIQDLLAQVAAEHEALQSKYDAALAEVDFLRTRLVDFAGPDSIIPSFRLDIQAAPSQYHCLPDPIHGSPPPDNDKANKSSNGKANTEEEKKPAKLERRATLTKQSSDVDWTINASRSDRRTKYLESHWLAQILANPGVDLFFMSIVLANVVFLWAECNRRAAELPQKAWAEVIEKVFLGIYIFEFVLRVIAYRKDVFADGWVRLDFLVIIIDVVFLLIDAIAGKSGYQMSIFRLLRVFRLVRLFKALRFVIEIQLLIHGLMGAVKAVLFATIMLEVVVLLWAFIYVEVVQPLVHEMVDNGAFADCARCRDAYGSMWNAHLTIFQQQVAGDSWGLLHLEIATEYPQVALLFVGSLMTIQFAMLNLILTVIVDAASRAREEDVQLELEEKKKTFEKQKDKLMNLCSSLDNNGNGELSLDELIEGYHTNQGFADTMSSLDLNVDDMSTLFMIMDEDRSGTVSKNEFVNNLYKMKEQDQRTMLMVIKAHIVDIRLKVNHDMRDILNGLKQSVDNIQPSDTLVQRVEQIMADSLADQKPPDLAGILSAAGLAGIEKNVERLSEEQNAIRQAIQQQAQVFTVQNTPGRLGCTQFTKMHPAASLIALPPSRTGQLQGKH